MSPEYHTLRAHLETMLKQWETRHKLCIECADSNEARGDWNAAKQIRAQAFGIKECANELKSELILEAVFTPLA